MKRHLACLPALLLAIAPTLAATPRIVVSIKPLHSLVAAVSAGVSDPVLLLAADASPHGLALRPSGARALANADLVFLVDETLEAVLTDVVHELARTATVVRLADSPGVLRLGVRRWDGEAHGHAGDGQADDSGRGAGAGARSPPAPLDPHLWLDPRNALAMVAHITSVLAALDPPNAERYAGNADDLSNRLRALDQELAGLLAGVTDRPFVVFHDAFQYLESRYGLRAVAAIAPNPERGYGARRVLEVRTLLRERAVACVFSEPQFEPKLVAQLVGDTGARAGVLDPLGAGIAPGPRLYVELMRNNARALRRCLDGPAPG